jgi:phage terminase small subunit
MPKTPRALNARQSLFAHRIAQGQPITEAAIAAGYANHTPGSKALQTPHVQAEIARIQTERLFNEVLPLAIQVHIDVLTNPATPAGARVQAVKLAYDRTLGGDAASTDKQPHEMSAEELAKAIAEAKLRAAALENVKADRAKPVIEGDLFG